MRLVALEVEGFRGWVDRQRVNLDADVVLIEGPNGTGKTSLCDAILWALTGELPRLGPEHRGDVVSMYSDGMARVCLELRARSGDALVVTRSTDGVASRLHVSTHESDWQDDAATQQLLSRLWPEGLRSTDSASMATSLARTAYLQQDEIRRFIEADSDSDRFDVVADLVGASRYTALQQQLESQRAAWSRQTTERKEDLDRVASEIATLEAQIQSLAESSVPPTGWLEWRNALGAIPGLEPVPEDAGSPRSSEALDAALRQLDELSRADRRKIDRALQVQADLGVALATPSPSEAATKAARQSAETCRGEVAQLQIELTAAEQAASAEHDALTRIAGQQREMHSLATIALRHLGDRCPVCDQDIVLVTVRDRLQAMLAPQAGQAPAPSAQRLSDISARLNLRLNLVRPMCRRPRR